MLEMKCCATKLSSSLPYDSTYHRMRKCRAICCPRPVRANVSIHRPARGHWSTVGHVWASASERNTKSFSVEFGAEGTHASRSDRSSSSRNEQYASGTDGLQNEYLWGNIDWPGLILTGRQLQYYLVIRRSVFIIKGQSEKLFVGRHPELHAKNDV